MVSYHGRSPTLRDKVRDPMRSLRTGDGHKPGFDKFFSTFVIDPWAGVPYLDIGSTRGRASLRRLRQIGSRYDSLGEARLWQIGGRRKVQKGTCSSFCFQ